MQTQSSGEQRCVLSSRTGVLHPTPAPLASFACTHSHPHNAPHDAPTPPPTPPTPPPTPTHRETLRLDPVVVGLMRTAVRDFDLGGYRVPAGKWLLLPLKWLASRDARWVDAEGGLAPDRFCPERMLTPEGLKPGDLMPFGHGPRCALVALCVCVCCRVAGAVCVLHSVVSVLLPVLSATCHATCIRMQRLFNTHCCSRTNAPRSTLIKVLPGCQPGDGGDEGAAGAGRPALRV